MPTVRKLRWRKIVVRSSLALFGVCVGVLFGVLLWVASLGAPRHEYLARPRAALVSVASQRVDGQPVEEVSLRAADGFVVRLGVVRDFSNESPRAVVIILGGHRTGRDAARLVGDPGNLAVVAVDYPYDGPDRIRGVRQAVEHAPAIRQALLDTPRALSQALDWVLQQPWADARRVELVGVSLGVPFAAVAGAQDARFSRVWIIQGGADNRLWIERNLERKISQPWLRRRAAWLVHRLAHGASFDTAAWVAKIAPRPVVIVGATEDERLSREQVELLFAAAHDPKELFWIAGRHVNPRRPETVQPILDLVRSRI